MPASFTSFSTTGDVLETCPSLSPSSLIHSHSFPTFISSFRTTSRRISHNKFLTSSSEYSPWKSLQLNRQMRLGRRAGRFADNLSLLGQRLYSPPADIMQYQNQTNASRKSLSITFSLAQSRAKPVESHFFLLHRQRRKEFMLPCILAGKDVLKKIHTCPALAAIMDFVHWVMESCFSWISLCFSISSVKLSFLISFTGLGHDALLR